MKAFILAAGLGTRLKPLTDTLPKALVPINGKPLLEHQILRLSAAGFQHLVINIHHHGEQILNFLAANNHFGLQIDVSDERDYLLDTGGAIKKAAVFLQGPEPFLVHNVDILSNADLKEFYHTHLKTPNALGSLLVSRRKAARRLLFDKQNLLAGWRNTESGEIKSPFPDFRPESYHEYAFAGIHVLSSAVLDKMMEWTGRYSIVDFYLSVCTKTEIVARPVKNLRLLDIGKPEAIEKAATFLKTYPPILP